MYQVPISTDLPLRGTKKHFFAHVLIGQCFHSCQCLHEAVLQNRRGCRPPSLMYLYMLISFRCFAIYRYQTTREILKYMECKYSATEPIPSKVTCLHCSYCWM